MIDDDKLTYEEFKKAIGMLKNAPLPTGQRWFVVNGTPLEDKEVIDFYRESNVIVLARDGNYYQYGELYQPEQKSL